MEVSGIVVGAAGLVGLFGACMDVLERVDSYKDFAIESRSTIARFEADKLRLRLWASELGISDGTGQQSLDVRLLDLQLERVVKEVLTSARELFDAAELTRSKLRISSGNNDGPYLPIRTASTMPMKGEASQPTSVRGGLGWAFRRKGKFTSQTEMFSEIVDLLYDIIPPQSANSLALASIRDDIQLLLEEMRRRLRLSSQKVVNDWLGIKHFDGGYDVNQFYDKQVSSRLEGTCEWIHSHPKYRSWVSDSSPAERSRLLWICAPAGFGKTILCASVVGHLNSMNTLQVAYFFATPHAQSGGEPNFILRSWISQIAQLDPDTLNLVRGHVEMSQRATDSTIWTLFRSIASQNRNHVFVLDGFDEYSRLDNLRAVFLQRLKEEVRGTATKILLFSREETDIKAVLLSEGIGHVVLQLRISEDDLRNDISLVAKIAIDNKFPQRDEGFRNDLAVQLADKCEGMFLWIKLQLDQLRSGKSAKQLKEIVKKMPVGLIQTYERNWKYIQSRLDDQRRALAILRWTTFALRPLSVIELTEALFYELNEADDVVDVDDLNDSIQNIDDEYIATEIIEICAGLVEVRTKTPDNGPESRTVHLIHTSVREFLVSNLPSGRSVASDRASSEAEHHSSLATLCLAYLGYDNVWQKEDTGQKYDFVSYAARYWDAHVTAASDDNELLERVHKFFQQDNPSFARWVLYYESFTDPSDGDEDIATTAATPLYYATLFDLTATMESILVQDLAQMDVTGGKYGTPLHVSCFEGHELAFELLVRWGADLNVEGGRFGLPINAAIYGGHRELVKALLRMGARLKLPDSGAVQLHIAADLGDLEIVSLLLDAGVSPNGAETLAPLEAASHNGHFAIVRLLLDNDADTEITSQGGFTPLFSASARGNYEIVELLLQRGANPGATIGEEKSFYSRAEWTPLHVAIKRGNLEIIKLLLRGVDLTATSRNCWTPLHFGIRYGNIEVLKLLVKEGADLSTSTSDGLSPLHLAFYYGHLSMVNYLLKEGADIKAVFTTQSPTLDSALHEDRFDAALLLLRRTADTNSVLCQCGSLIHHLAFKGQTKLLRLIYENYHRTWDHVDSQGRSVLHLAARGGHTDTMEYLVSIGVDPQIRNVIGDGLLTYAASGASLKVVKAILKMGPIYAEQSGPWSPLHWACRKGSAEIVEELISNGIRTERVTTSQPRQDWTPASIAVFHGHQTMLEKLSSLSRFHVGVEQDVSMTNVEPLIGKRHDRYYCDGCINVSTQLDMMISTNLDRKSTDRVFSARTV
jgi:ankyrin repeat protein